jgi:hypothetical protein
MEGAMSEVLNNQQLSSCSEIKSDVSLYHIAYFSCLRPVPSCCSAGLRARPHQARRPGSPQKEDARK